MKTTHGFSLTPSVRNSASAVIGAVLLVCSINLLAQDGVSNSYSDAFKREKIRQHTVSLSSRDDAGIIPIHIYYELIFKEIIRNPEINELLPLTDWEVIRNLPSRFDKQFSQVDLMELSGICAMERNGAISSMEVASAFDLSRKRSERTLDEYYSGAIRSLSTATRRYVESRKRELGQSDQIGYSILEMSKLEADAPGIARELIARRCPQLLENIDTFSPVSRKLQDGLTKAFPIGADR